jgi:hypothetical protein
VTRTVRAVLAAGILALGIVAVATAPNGTAVLEPFAAYAGPDGIADGRRVSAQVLDVRLAERITPDYGFDEPSYDTTGVWVVVECVVTAREDYTALDYVELEIGERVFRTIDILPAPNLTVLPYGAGVPMRGALVFEVPESALTEAGASGAHIVFNTSVDNRLDSLAVAVVDLSALTVEPEALVGAAHVPDGDDG